VIVREERIGGQRLILGDCRDVMPTLGRVDAVVTDPPYGLGDKLRIGGFKKWPLMRAGMRDATWDNQISPGVCFSLGIADHAIVWGGNYYPLPPSRCWLLWDKKQSDAWYSTAHFEMAWTNMNKNAHAFRMSQVEAHTGMNKEHPSQKPLRLMAWCLDQAGKPATVLDPFMGSGSTGVACVQLGKAFTGIERERKYFDIACERIARAQAQGQLLPPEPVAAPEQQTMEL
jgi:site-specific DNA-methyltransferase (adenine-specific)/modification methylase